MRLTLPVPSSSAPGARPEVGLFRLIESMCAPRMVMGAAAVPMLASEVEVRGSSHHSCPES
jgi:hypothetical protein